MHPTFYRRAKFDAATSRYRVAGVPPGEYVAFALDTIPEDAEYNAAFLREFDDRGVRVTVEAGKSVGVRVPMIELRPPQP
jgi:hypothetical protein